MTARNVFEGTIVLILLVLLGAIGWQTALNKSDIGQVAESVHKLLDEGGKGWATKKDVDDLRTKITSVENALDKNMDATYGQSVITGQLAKKVNQEIPEQLAKLNATLAATNERLAKAETSAALAANFGTRLDKVEADLKANSADLLANVEATREHSTMLMELAMKDNVGRWIPALGKARKSDEFRDEFRKAVIEATPPQIPSPQPWGTIRIENRMANWQYLEVNGDGRWVGPLSYLDVIVPAGWATTRLPAYESAKPWWLGAPSYFQTVIIDRQPAYSPVASNP